MRRARSPVAPNRRIVEAFADTMKPLAARRWDGKCICRQRKRSLVDRQEDGRPVPQTAKAFSRDSGVTEASPARANMGFIGAIVAVATIGGFLFGYDSGAVNGTQEGLRTAFSLGDAGLGFTVGSLLIGCFIGAFFAGRLADLIGRRNTMMLAAVLF